MEGAIKLLVQNQLWHEVLDVVFTFQVQVWVVARENLSVETCIPWGSFNKAIQVINKRAIKLLGICRVIPILTEYKVLPKLQLRCFAHCVFGFE